MKIPGNRNFYKNFANWRFSFFFFVIYFKYFEDIFCFGLDYRYRLIGFDIFIRRARRGRKQGLEGNGRKEKPTEPVRMLEKS